VVAGPCCAVRVAGHAVHPTRLRRCLDRPATRLPVVVMGAVGDVLPLAYGAQLRRYRNHDSGRLLSLTAGAGPRALLDERYALLFLHTGPRDAGSVFSLQPADHLPHPCAPGGD